MAQLDKYKQAIVDVYQNTNKNIFVSATAGCLGIDIPVLMYDGSVKMSQDIRVGDELMGADSSKRTVLNISKGFSNLYKVKPVKGEEWVCNDSHVFTVHDQYISRSMRLYKTSHKTDIVDKNIQEILKFQKNDFSIGHLKLVRTGVEFEEKDTIIDPYLMGLWIAEGTKNDGRPCFSICRQDKEIIQYLLNYSLPLGYKNSIKDDSENCVQIRFSTIPGNINIFRNEFRKCINNDGSISIPKEYLINSKKNRFKLLAGILDGDGYLGKDKAGISISTKWGSLGKDIVYLVRSLGLYAHYKWKKSTIKSRNFEGTYFRIGIYGNTELIPNILKRKHANQRKQNKNVLHTGFSLIPIGKGNWYGFTVDKDNRYLLGDFTITHNSGKTFCLCELARRTPPTKSLIFLAFNKSIATELGNKLPNTVKAQTLHSCAFSALHKAFNFKWKISENKYFSLAKNVLNFKGVKPNKVNAQIVSICETFSLMRFNLCPLDVKLIVELADRYGLCINEEIAKQAITLHIADENNFNQALLNGADEIIIDFTDMLYYAVKYIDDDSFKRYNIVMVDECQDLSPLQYSLVQKLKTPRGRLIAVGDEKQSIYSFMGSNLDSLQAIKETPNTICLPLSITYRCGVEIVNEAKHVFPDGIEAAPNAIQGEVTYGDVKEAVEGDYVLCRNNAPLMDAFIDLTKQGKKCNILGKDFGEELVKLINNVEDIYQFEQLMNDLEKKLQDKGIKNPYQTKIYSELDDKVCALLNLFCYFGSLEKVKECINNVFVENSNPNNIILSTIHKSKGLEADRVFFLKPELLPSKFATTELSLYSEKCLKFVAITRAKKKLIYC